MARRRSRKLWRKEWMTHPSGTLGFSHLFSAALAEFALHLSATGCCLQPPPGMLDKVDLRCVAIQMDITSLQAAGF